MSTGLSLRVSQNLALTPQLQQAIRLLQLSTVDLEREVQTMLDENPFLERADDAAPREEFGLARADAPVSEGDRSSEAAASSDGGNDGEGSDSETAAPDDWDGDGSSDLAPDDGEWGGEAPARQPGDDTLDPAERASLQESLTEHLHRQALALRLAPEDMAALRFLIESVDDDGYLPDSLAQLAATLMDDDDGVEEMQELVHRFTLALKLLQSLEPTGVGARNLPECLALQLKERLGASNPSDPGRAAIENALKLCTRHGALELLARRDTRRLTAQLGISKDELRAAQAVIARLEPKPGRRFANAEREIIVPDVIVTASGSGPTQKFHVRLNHDLIPRLRVHDAYASALRGSKNADLGQRLQEARWFVRNVQQRFDTILRVAELIVERQRGFFVHGPIAMRPMLQKDIAEALGVNESTISRVTTAKYMATPQGTFELKHFFSSSLGTEAGGSASSIAVRALIKQFIESENPAQPLPDGQIADLLKEQGIDCARRTVAKYREEMHIPAAPQRRHKG